MADSFGTDAAKAPGPYDISESELKEMRAAREREYATTTLVDRELGIDAAETGLDVMVAAAAHLRLRGVRIEDASQEELLNALVAVSS